MASDRTTNAAKLHELEAEVLEAGAIVVRLQARLAERDAALRTLRDAWNAHMETCPQHAALPDLPAPTWAELNEWANAPSNTAAGGVLAPRENHDADVSGTVDPLDNPRWKPPSPPDLIGDPNFDPKGDDELSV